LRERLIANGCTFTSPYDDAIDRAAYFKRCWPTSGFFKGFVPEKVVELSHEVFVNHKAITNDGREFHNVEVLTFRGEQIRAVNVFFGATYKGGKFVKMPEMP
jgi:hypothetical protein